MFPDEFEKLVFDAQGALEAGEHVRALALLDQLQAADRTDGRLHELRARTLLALNNVEAASVEAERAVEQLPESASSILLLAEISARLKRVIVAQSQFERAIELSQRDPAVLTRYAMFMASERGPRPAEVAARDALQANENSAEAWAALGLAQLRMHQRPRAEASLKRALAADPNSPFAQQVMVMLLRSRRENDKAAALVEMMQDEPANAEFVAEVRKDLNRDRAFQKLLERPQVQERLFKPTRLPGTTIGNIVTLLSVALSLATTWYLVGRHGSPLGIGLSIAIVIFIGFRVRSLFQG